MAARAHDYRVPTVQARGSLRCSLGGATKGEDVNLALKALASRSEAAGPRTVGSVVSRREGQTLASTSTQRWPPLADVHRGLLGPMQSDTPPPSLVTDC